MQEYSKKDIEQNLKDAGCDEAMIDEFMECVSCKNEEAEKRLLEKHRKCLLEQVHEGEKKINCLDYLNHQLKKNKQEMKQLELETERLILRKIRKEDVSAIFECWMQDEDVSRYMFWKASDDRKDAEEFVEYELENIENERWNRWLIVTKDKKELIGTCLIYFNEEEGHWDISYNLGKKYWGKGYITEAMSSVLQYGKDALGMKTCETACAVENTASAHVLEKLGFQFVQQEPYECNGGTIVTVGKRYVLTNV